MTRGSRSNGKDALGALLVAVDGEGDALGEKRLVGLDLELAELVGRRAPQLVEQGGALRPHLARAIEHLVVGAVTAVAVEQIVRVAP